MEDSEVCYYEYCAASVVNRLASDKCVGSTVPGGVLAVHEAGLIKLLRGGWAVVEPSKETEVGDREIVVSACFELVSVELVGMRGCAMVTELWLLWPCNAFVREVIDLSLSELAQFG